jgi:hypothetical protein
MVSSGSMLPHDIMSAEHQSTAAYLLFVMHTPAGSTTAKLELGLPERATFEPPRADYGAHALFAEENLPFWSSQSLKTPSNISEGLGASTGHLFSIWGMIMAWLKVKPPFLWSG